MLLRVSSSTEKHGGRNEVRDAEMEFHDRIVRSIKEAEKAGLRPKLIISELYIALTAYTRSVVNVQMGPSEEPTSLA